MTSNDPREASVAKCTCGTRVFQIAVQWARRVSLACAALLSRESTMRGVRVVWVRFRRRRLEQRSAANEPPVYLAAMAGKRRDACFGANSCAKKSCVGWPLTAGGPNSMCALPLGEGSAVQPTHVSVGVFGSHDFTVCSLTWFLTNTALRAVSSASRATRDTVREYLARTAAATIQGGFAALRLFRTHPYLITMAANSLHRGIPQQLDPFHVVALMAREDHMYMLSLADLPDKSGEIALLSTHAKWDAKTNKWKGDECREVWEDFVMRGDTVEHHASADEGWSPFMYGSSLLAADCRSLPEAYSKLGAWALRWAALFRKERREIDLYLVLPVPVGVGDAVDLDTFPVRVCAACHEGCSAATPRWLAECDFAPVTPGGPYAVAPMTPPNAAPDTPGGEVDERPRVPATPMPGDARSSTPCGG